MSDNPAVRRVLVKPDELLGHVVDGKYTLESIIGGGGMGVVYGTTQPNFGRQLALKLLKFDDSADDRLLRRFERELGIMAQLAHPNIVNVLEAGQDRETALHYVVMERVDGITLEDLLHGHRLRAELAVDIGIQICSALSEPHAKGVVHRDVKPANIMISLQADGRVLVKLLDFGIARSAEAQGNAKITTTNTVIGSPSYMAPEAASGSSFDHRTDLYSFGVVLYEMLAGDVPFRGTTPVAIMLRHAVEAPEPISQRLPEFPYVSLSGLVDQLLAKEADDRPAHALSVLQTLEAVQSSYDFRPIRVTEVGSSVTDSLSDYLLSRRTVADETPFDHYGATKTYTGNTTGPIENFDGWMVPQTVAEKLETGVQSAATEPRSSRSGAWLAVGVICAVVLVGVSFKIYTDRTEAPEQVEPPVNERPATDNTVVRVVEPDPAPEPEPVVFEVDELEPGSQAPTVVPPVKSQKENSANKTPEGKSTEEKSPEEKSQPRAGTKRGATNDPRKEPTKPESGSDSSDEPSEDSSDIDKGFEWLKNK